MSSYVVTPMKNIPVIAANPADDDASRRGMKRKLEFVPAPTKFKKRVKQRRKNPLQMPENIDPNIFYDRCSEITGAITYKYGTIVFVWSPSSTVSGDFISTLVNKNNKVIGSRDRWLPASSRDARMKWGGLTVLYEQEKDAISAANDLPLQSKHIKTIRLSKIINDLANIESGHELYGSGFTEVSINCGYTIGENERGLLEHRLRLCGEVVSCRFEGRVCEARYKFFTHAHLACVIFHQDEDDSLGKMSAILKKSEKDEGILDLLKENVMLHLEDGLFTR